MDESYIGWALNCMKIGENELANELLGEAVKIIDDRIKETGDKETEPNYQRSLSKSL